MTNKNLGQPVKNRFKVQKRQWARWSNHAKRVFNQMFVRMRHQTVLIHPEAAVMHKTHWDTVRWNSAWLAADAADKYPAYTKVITMKGKKRGN